VLRDVTIVDAVSAPEPVRVRPGRTIREELQRVMTRDAGVVRSAESLERAADALSSMSATDVESANLLAVSSALVRAATARRESRGTHTRSDYPTSSSAFLGRLVFTGPAAPEFVPLAATEAEPSR
jgi:aspartate oxidase